MTDQVVGKLVWQAELDARRATQQAEKYEDTLEKVRREQAKLTAAEKDQAKASRALREEVLRLGRAELDGAGDKKALAAQSRAARQALREQAEATRQLRDAQRALAAEERVVNAERSRAVRIERERQAALARSARSIAADQRGTLSARGRSSRADDRMRGVLQRQGAVGGRIEELQASIADLDAQLAGVGKYSRTSRTLRALGGRARTLADEAPGRFAAGVPSAVGGALRVAGGLAGAAGAGVGAVASVGGEFESLRTSLGTALGSQKDGAAAFEQVRQFAKETPFAVKEVVQAVTTLKVRGLEPTVEAAMVALRTYGDVAGALGKDLPTVIEAVSDASLGEFERLKEAFNVVGHKSGDEIKLTFNGVTTTVKNNADEITGYLKQIGKENFAGGMELQAKTLQGTWSNLGDAVSVFADEVYRNGLGDALKEILLDITGTVEGSDELSRTIGETLAEAVRGAYEWFKQLIGPIDELPGKFERAWEVGQKFVSVVGDLVAAGAKLVEVLGPGGTAIAALGIAATAALGPLGGLLALGWGLGMAFAEARDSILGVDDAIAELKLKAQVELEGLRRETQQAEEARDEVLGRNKEAEAKAKRGAEAEGKFRAARLRGLGKNESELTKAERADLENTASRIYREARDGDQGRAAGQGKLGPSELVSREEGRANRAVYDRLSRIPSKKRTVAQELELKAAAKALGVKTPSGAAKKPHLSTSEQELENTIKTGAATAGRQAYDAAILQGRDAKHAAAAGKVAEAEAKKRLEAQSLTGRLPGQVNTAFARVAGYGDVVQAPPPPVFVMPIRIDVQAPVKVEGTFTGDPARIGAIAAAHVRDVLETEVLPELAQQLKPAWLR